MHHKQLIVFDLDGTLAESKSPLTKKMASALQELLDSGRYVAVISGASWQQYKSQFLQTMQPHKNMIMLPTCGAQMFVYNGENYTKVYSRTINHKDKRLIEQVWTESVQLAKVKLPKSCGPVIEDRDTQITFSMCGQNAPIEIKKKWDPKFSKRKRILEHMKPKLPDYEVRMGGTTSIDVTTKGIDKAFGLNKLFELEQYPFKPQTTLFVGDALFEGGNDAAVKSVIGLEWLETSGPEETEEIISQIIRGNHVQRTSS